VGTLHVRKRRMDDPVAPRISLDDIDLELAIIAR
jgi:hypothetical protein